MIKRILSVLLILCILLGNLPQWTLPASAVGESFGNDLQWDFAEETGVLTITGTGDMPNWTYGRYTPWAEHLSDIKAVKISAGVTSVGNYAFDGCNNLTTVSIGEDVKVIGKYAFRYCNALTEVTIPHSVTEIKDQAFYLCKSLKTVTLGKGVTTLGSSAFNACDAFEEYRVDPENEVFSSDDRGVLFNKDKTVLIHCPEGYSGTYAIPAGVERLEESAFSGCSGLTGVTIPEGITTISRYAFGWTGLTGVTIPQGVTIVESSAFFNCPYMAHIELPDTLQEIGEEAFYLCREVTEITIPKSVMTIGRNAFSQCDELTALRIDPENEYYSTDEYGVLFNKNKMTLMQFPVAYAGEYVIPDGVTVIEDEAFSGARDLTAVTIADTVTEIGREAFEECSGLTAVVLPDGLSYLGERAFCWCDSLESVWIGEGLSYLESSVFECCSSLTTVVLPESLTELGYDVFFDCYDLSRIVVLNPNCDLHYNEASLTLVPEGIICGHLDSTAEHFAQECGYTFYALCQCEDYACDYSGESVEATCTEDGGIRYTCGICGYAYLIPEVPATGHSYLPVVIPPTCTEEGYTTYTCEICGDSYTDDPVEATGHSYVPAVTPPTCTEEGITVYHCSVCGDSYADPPVGATGHHYSPTVTPPTCTEEGYTTYTCEGCGDAYTQDTVPPTGHSHGPTVTPPTCTEEGYTTHTCGACGDAYTDSPVPATGHSYTYAITEPTCTEEGYTTHTCTTCGDTYTDSVLAPLGHKYSSVERAPTCTEAGGIVHTCSVCGDTYIEDPVAPYGHDLTTVVTPPTCEEEGYTTYDCTVCGETYIGEKVPALGHVLSERTYADPMNHEGFCSRCEQMATERHTAANNLCLCGVYAGTCGEKLVWVLQPETGLLTVAGTGAMTNWSSGSKTPWYAYRASIKAVEITSGVTSVGNYAFNGFGSVITVTTGDTVTSVGSYAFQNCTGLTDLTVWASSLGASAFGGCTGLLRVTLPVDYTVAQYPFTGCTKVQEIRFTPGKTGVMVDCAYNNTPYHSNSLGYVARGSLQKVTFDEGITHIGNYTFYTDTTSTLTEVIFPKTLQSIGSYAFYNSKNLSSISLPDSLKTLGSYCFYGCSGMKTIRFSSSLTQIPTDCFYGCSGLTKLVIPETVISVGNYAFQNCTGLTDLTVWASSLGSNAFRGCTGLLRVTLPVDYTVAQDPFEGCTKVQEIRFTPGTTGVMVDCVSNNYNNTLGYAARGSLQKVTFDEGITHVGSYSFYTDTTSTLTEVIFPKTLQSIGSYAFYKSKNLSSIYLPDSLKTLGSCCFYGCSGMKTIRFSSSLTQIPTYCFYGCSGLKKASIPGRVTAIGNRAFYGCSNLTTISIPNRVTSIGSSAFQGCTGLSRVTIPDSVTSLGSSAFANCTGLTRATVGSGVGSISSAFSGCSSLRRVTIEHPKCSISGSMGPKDYMVVYGYDESTAQSYAKSYGYEFVSIGSSAGWSGPDASVVTDSVYEQSTGGLTLTIFTNLMSPENAFKYYTLADSATVEYKNKTYTLTSADKGQITLPYTGGSLVVRKAGYVDQTLEQAALNGSRNVYLQQISYSHPVIKGLWLEQAGLMLNILEVGYNIMPDSGSMVIKPEIDWGNSLCASVALYQGANTVYLTEGENTIDWTRKLDLTEDIYLVATNIHGKTVKQKVNIKLADPLDGFKFSVGDKISLKIPDSSPMFGGATFSVGLPTDLAVDYYIENGKVYLSFGAQFGFDRDSESGKMERQTFREEVKNLCKLPKSSWTTYKKNLDWKKLFQKTEPTFGFGWNFMVGGYGEAYIKSDGSLEYTDGGMLIIAEAEYSETYPFYLWVVPCFVEAKTSGTVEAKGAVDINYEYREFTPNVDMEAEIAVDGRVGAGIKKFLNISGGMEGKFKADWDINCGKTDYFRLGATANLYFKAEFMGMSYKNPADPFVDVTLLEYPLRKSLSEYVWDGYAPNFYDLSAYSISDLRYLEQASQFLPGGKSAQRSGVGDVVVTDFLTNAYSDAETRMVSFSDGTRLALWMGTGGSSDINDLQLHASYYDGENWSEPVAVDPDGTLDGEVSAIATEDGAYLVWQDLTEAISETATLEDIASIVGISFAHFDKENGIFAVRSLTDEVEGLNMMPTLCETGDGVCVVWVNNGDSLWFGNEEANDILCRHFRNGEWSNVETLYADLRSVESLAVSEVEGELQIAYCVDADGDLNTVEDTDAYLNGQLLEENALMDSGVIFAGETLYRYRDGMIVEDSGAEIVKLETDRFTVVDENGVKAIVYNSYKGLHSTIYGVFYDPETEAWGEPVALTSSDGSYSDFSAFVDEAGKLNLFVNRVEIVGDYSAQDPYGEATLQLITRTLACDLAIADMYYDCSTYVAGGDMVFDVSVANRGALAANGLIVRLVDDTGAVLMENLYQDTILPGEAIDISCGFKAKTVTYGKRVTVTVTPYDGTDLNLTDNSKTVELKYDDLAVESVGYGMVEEDIYTIYADVVNRSYASRNVPMMVYLREGSVDGRNVDCVPLDEIGAMSSVRVSFEGLYSPDVLYYVVIETEETDDNPANDYDYLMITAETCSHVYAYTDNGEDHTILCELCGKYYTKAHNYIDGTCACGSVEYVEPTLVEGIQIGRTLNLASDISINYLVNKGQLDGYDSYYLECNVPIYDGNERTGEETYLLEPELRGNVCYFTLDGLVALQMNDEVTTVLRLTKDGTEYVTPENIYSIATYAYNQLNKSATSDALKRLCADLLQYGSVAQNWKGYRTDALADEKMTEEHRAYLTTLTDVTFNDNKNTLEDFDNASIIWKGNALKLESKVVIRFIFVPEGFTGDCKDLSLHLSYTDCDGEEVDFVIHGAEEYQGYANAFVFDVETMPASEMRSVVSAVVYDGDTRLSATRQYSVDTYGIGKSGALLTMAQAIIAYGDQAAKFFAN